MEPEILPGSNFKSYYSDWIVWSAKTTFEHIGFLLTIAALCAGVALIQFWTYVSLQMGVDMNYWTVILPVLAIPLLFLIHLARYPFVIYKKRDIKAFNDEASLKAELKKHTEQKIKVSLDTSVAAGGKVYNCGLDGHAATYFRLLFESDYLGDLKDCSAHLTSIRIGDKLLMGHERRRLTFSGDSTDPFTRTISRGAGAFVDVVLILEIPGNNCVKVGQWPRLTERTPEGQEVFSKRDDYTLVVVTGNNATKIKVTAKFMWRNTVQDSTIDIISFEHL